MDVIKLFERNVYRNSILLLLFLIFLKHSNNSLAQSDGFPHPEKNPGSGLMLVGDWVPENTHEIDFFSLPVIPSEHTIVSDVRYAAGRKVNQHNYLVFFGGKFWAMWSDGPGEARTDDPVAHRDIMPGHDRFGQRILYSTSSDGTDWSEPRDLAGPPDDGFGWIARGLWVRDGQLLALVTRYRAPTFMGEGLQLHAWKMTPGEDREWKYKGLVFDNAMNNFPDATSKFSGMRLSDGRYILVSNPNPAGRNPLTLAVSDDGKTFNKMGYLVGGRHVGYPHVIEHDGFIYVAFASAKQSVEVLKIKIEDLDFSMEP